MTSPSDRSTGLAQRSTGLAQRSTGLDHLRSLNCLLLVACSISISCLFPVRGLAQFPTIEVTTIQPSVAQAGTSFELRFGGNRLDELTHATFTPAPSGPTALPRAAAPTTSVVTDVPITATPKVNERRLLDNTPLPSSSFDVALSESASTGLYDVRAVGRFGISNPRRMLVTRKPVAKPPAGHIDTGNAFALPLDSIIAGECTPQQRNHYSLHVTAGQTLRCVAYSQPLDSRASLVLTLIDERGQELGHSRSVQNWPGELAYEAKRDVDLYLVVHDSLYQGGTEFSYALEATVGPAEEPLELNTLLRPSLTRPAVDASLLATASDQPLSPAFIVEDTLASGQYSIDFTTLDQQPLELQVASYALDSLTDPALVIYKVEQPTEGAEPQLSQVAQQDDAPTLGRPDVRLRRLDPNLLWTPPAAGTFRAHLFDQQAGARPVDATEFRLSIAPAVPSFALVAYSPFPSNNPAGARGFGSNLLRGGSESIHVLIDRRGGFQGPVELSVAGLPEGIVCHKTYVPAAAAEADLIVVSSEDAPAWHGPIRVVGEAKVGEQTISVPAEIATIQWAAVPTRNAVQHRPSPELWLCSNAADLSPLSIQLGTPPVPKEDSAPAETAAPTATAEGTSTPATETTPTTATPTTSTPTPSTDAPSPIMEVARGAKLSLPITLVRREGGQGECTLRPQGLATGVSLGEIKIAADQSAGTAELSVAADAPLGEFTLWMQVETKVKFRANPQALEREEAYLASLKSAAESANDEAKKAALNANIESTAARVEELKKSSAEQELTVWLPSTPQTIRVLPAAN